MLTLYCRQIPFTVSDRDLFDAFAEYGSVLGAQVIRDHQTGLSRGFGFISFERDEDAHAAIAALNGCDWGPRSIGVGIARDQRPVTTTPQVPFMPGESLGGYNN